MCDGCFVVSIFEVVVEFSLLSILLSISDFSCSVRVVIVLWSVEFSRECSALIKVVFSQGIHSALALDERRSEYLLRYNGLSQL